MGMFLSDQEDTFEINEEYIHTYLDDIIIDKDRVSKKNFCGKNSKI